MAKQNCYGLPGNSPTTGQYASLMGKSSGWGSEANLRSPAPCSGTLRNFKLRLEVAPGVGNTRTFTIRKAGAGTGLTLTFGAADTLLTITGVDVSVTAGDLLAMEHTSTGVPASSGINWVFEFEGSTTKQSMYSMAAGGANATPTTIWSGVFNHSAAFEETDPLNIRNVVAVAGDITGLRILVTADPGAGNGFTAYINKNTVRQDGGGGTVNTACALISGGATQASASFTLSVSPGDVLYIEWVVTGSFTTRNWAFGVQFTSSSNGQSQISGFSQTLSASSTEFQPLVNSAAALDTTETNFAARLIAGVTGARLSGLRLVLSAAPGAGNNYAYTIKKNTSPTSITDTVSDAETTGSDTTNTADIVANDLLCIASVPTSTPTVNRTFWGLIQDMGSVNSGGGNPKGGPKAGKAIKAFGPSLVLHWDYINAFGQ